MVRTAVRGLGGVAHAGLERVHAAIALLAQDSRPLRARRLPGRPGYRVRVGDDRIIYSVDDGALLIVVVTLGHRREVHRT